jgi:tetratricopeptide (TPR) repeat protein
MNRRQRRAQAKFGRTARSAHGEPALDKLSPASTELLQLGLGHYHGGRLSEAEACYRRALADRPDFVVAQFNLGVVLHDQEKIDDAIATYHEAIRINPHYEPAYSKLGHALYTQGRFEEAVGAFKQSLRLKPNHAETYFSISAALYRQNRFEEAVAACRKALRINPNYAEAHNSLGAALLRLGMPDEAIAALRKAIELKPDLAAAHHSLAVTLKQLGRFSEAAKSFEQAIGLAPANVYFRLAASGLKRFVAGDPRLAELEEMAKDSTSRPVRDQIELHFALGKAYDDMGRCAEAFGNWLAGNTLKRQQIGYDEAKTLEELDQVRSVYTSEFIQASQGTGYPSSVPIFIIGMPRSGSTLIEQILASHPRVFGAGELHDLAAAVESTLMGSGSSAGTKQKMQDIGARYVAAIERRAPGAIRITDKLPRNFIFAGLIHLALPNAAIIHTIRDPIDTCLSCFSTLFTAEQDFTYDLAELGRYYRRYQSLMAHWHRALPSGRILDVRYEDVVADLEGQARRIVANCGLDWDPQCLAFHKTERVVQTASATQVRQPIYKDAVERWRRYEEFLVPLMAELKSTKSV